jgi:hypothetical protein
MDPNMVCMVGFGGIPTTLYISINDNITPGTMVFADPGLSQQPNFGPGIGWYFFDPAGNQAVYLTNQRGGMMAVNSTIPC